MDADQDSLTSSNQAAWNTVAQKYASEVRRDIEFLRAGGVSLAERERLALMSIPRVGRAIHLQCSHGLDTLSLVNLGFAEVIGIDLSEAMLLLARQKSDELGFPAQWIHADVLEPPESLRVTADLVYTGKGAIPWLRSVSRWAEVIAWLLRPGGYLYVYEAHPLDWIWQPGASSHRLHAQRSYFDDQPRENEDFPASAVARYSVGDDRHPPVAWEYHHTLGEIVTALLRAGLDLLQLAEHSEDYWPRFPRIATEEMARLPHTFSLLARRPTA